MCSQNLSSFINCKHCGWLRDETTYSYKYKQKNRKEEIKVGLNIFSTFGHSISRPFIHFNVYTLTKTEIYSPLGRNEHNNKTGTDNKVK